MRNTYFLILFGFAAAVGICAAAGFYPVAAVGFSVITRHGWREAERAAEKFYNTQNLKLGIESVDFSRSENAALRRGMERESLTALIESELMRQAGEKEIPDFDSRVQGRVDSATRGKNTLERAATLSYGLNLDDFRRLILVPQARLEILTDDTAKKGTDFKEWFKNFRKTKKVRLFFTSFRWNGETVE